MCIISLVTARPARRQSAKKQVAVQVWTEFVLFSGAKVLEGHQARRQSANSKYSMYHVCM